MKIEDGKIKPCSSCYGARQVVKDFAAKIVGKKQATLTLVQCHSVDFTIANSTRNVIAVSHQEFAYMIGRRVYVAGKQLIDVALAERVKGTGEIISVTPVDMDYPQE